MFGMVFHRAFVVDVQWVYNDYCSNLIAVLGRDRHGIKTITYNVLFFSLGTVGTL